MDIGLHQGALVAWYKASRPHLVRCEHYRDLLTVEEFAAGLDAFRRKEFEL